MMRPQPPRPRSARLRLLALGAVVALSAGCRGPRPAGPPVGSEARGPTSAEGPSPLDRHGPPGGTNASYRAQAPPGTGTTEAARQALRARPKSARAHGELGFALYKVGKYREAIVELRAALGISPRVAVCLFYLGESLRAIGRPAEAEAAYRKLVTCADMTTDQRSWAYDSLGEAQWDQGHYRDAEASLKAALALWPNDQHASFGLGILAANDRRPDDAKRYLEMALRDASGAKGAAKVHYVMGQSAEMADRKEEAAAEYRKALAADPDHEGARRALSDVLLRSAGVTGEARWTRERVTILPAPPSRGPTAGR